MLTWAAFMPTSTPKAEPNTISRLALPGLLILPLVLLIAGYLLMPASTHFRLFHDQKSFCRVMSQRIEPGMTLDQVEDLLGHAEIVSETDQQLLIRSINDSVTQKPNPYPDGAAFGDKFMEYEFGTFGVYLQFREGKLINHSRREYDYFLSQLQ